MAGERKGVAYEAIVKIALEELVKKHKLNGQVFWNEKPLSMTIEPDFTVGVDKDDPSHVFLVTHSGAAGNSHMKFWRNMGELTEAKVRLPMPARTYSIVFDSVVKEDLKALQAAVFDGQLIVGDLDYGRRLRSWVDANNASLPKDGYEKADAIRAAMKDKSRPDNPKALIDALVRDLATLIKGTRTEPDALWAKERKRVPGRAPAARDTFLRRGVGKLLLLDHSDDVDSSGRFKKGVSSEVVDSLKTMGLVGDSIGGPRLTDPEMLWPIRNLPPDALAELHTARTIDRVAEWIESLRSLAGVRDQLEYLVKHWSELTTGSGLYRHLTLCHRGPHALCRAAVAAGSKRVWLFHVVMEWIKLAGGSRTAFGLAKLVDDLRVLSTDESHRKAVHAILKREVIWRSPNTVDRGLRDWHSASGSSGTRFTDDDLARVADALARRLGSCPKPDPKADTSSLVEATIQSVLEAKLLTYRDFKPLEVLLRRELTRIGLVGRMEVVRACFAEAANGASMLAAATTVMHVRNTLINWQSAHGSHTNDKRKELCARAPALRYVWDSKMHVYTKRPATEKLVLLVDGTWRQDDLNALARAGWDEIFYPDEMDKLVKAIV